MPKVVRTAVVIAVFALVCTISDSVCTAASKPPLGIVVLGQRATIGDAPLAAGASLFDGDSVATQQKGLLQIRVEGAQLMFSENAAASLHRADRGIYAELSAGMVRFSGAAGTSIEIRALGAVIRGHSDSSAGQIIIVSPNEFRIGATSGSLTVDVDGDIRTVAEGTAYDAMLSSDDPQSVYAGKHKRILSWVIIFLIAIGTIIPVWRATLSPHKLN